MKLKNFLNNLPSQLGLVGLVWGLDSLVKVLLVDSRIELSWNEGVAFGLFPGLPWEWILLLLLALVWWQWARVESRVEWWGWGLIVAGGWSNLVDRLLYGSVRDYIYYPVISVNGNLADVGIVLGGVLLGYIYLIRDRKVEKTINH